MIYNECTYVYKSKGNNKNKNNNYNNIIRLSFNDAYEGDNND